MVASSFEEAAFFEAEFAGHVEEGPHTFMESSKRTERLVYKLVKVTDDGTVMPATEEEALKVEPLEEEGCQSGSEHDGGPLHAVCQGGLLEFEGVTFDPRVDYEAERRRLLARMQVLNELLLKVEAEARLRTDSGEFDAGTMDFGPDLGSPDQLTINVALFDDFLGNNMASPPLTPPILSPTDSPTASTPQTVPASAVHPLPPGAPGVTSPTAEQAQSRARRPNPKYFEEMNADADTADMDIDKKAPAFPPLPVSRPRSLVNRPNKSAIRRTESYLSQDGSLLRAGSIDNPSPKGHSHRTESSGRGRQQLSNEEAAWRDLDKLSVRELHAAFKEVYGLVTTVKDKDWLTRRINDSPKVNAAKEHVLEDETDSLRFSLGLGRLEPLTSSADGSKVSEGQDKPRVGLVLRFSGKIRGQREMLLEDIIAARDAALVAKGLIDGTGGVAERTNWEELSKLRKRSRADSATRKSKKRNRKVFPKKKQCPLESLVVAERIGSDYDQGVLFGLEGEGEAGFGTSGSDQNQEDADGGQKRQRKPNPRYLEEVVSEDSPLSSSPPYEPVFKLGPAAVGLRTPGERKPRPAVMTESFASEDSPSLGTKRKQGDEGGFEENTAPAKGVRTAESPKLEPQKADAESDGGTASTDHISYLIPHSPSWGSISPILGPRCPEKDALEVKPTSSSGGGQKKKHQKEGRGYRPWTLEEVETLVEGVEKCGGGKWADIKKLSFADVTYRTPVDLKDKWRNLLRASRMDPTQIKPPQEGSKKQIAAILPQDLLKRVRELAAAWEENKPISKGSSSRGQ